jgi:8-oxo-dGTP pyrophosphatase MutT (NUDIX family)
MMQIYIINFLNQHSIAKHVNLFYICNMEKKAVCVILQNTQDQILGVSRKTDHNDMGLVGGKVDDTDPSPEYAAIRETKEETGLDITNLKLVDTRIYDGYHTLLYVADYSGEINYDEPHVVKWVDPSVLLQGSFGDYNENAFKLLGII